MMTIRHAIRLAAVGVLLLTHPALARGQRLFVEPRVGLVFPAGDLADLEKTGTYWAVGVGYWFPPRVALRADVSRSFMQGKERADEPGAVPSAVLTHFTAGVEAQLFRASPFWMAANVGAGVTRFHVDGFNIREGGEPRLVEISETDFTLAGGLRAGYDLTRRIALVLSAQGYRVFTADETTAPLGPLAGGQDGFDGSWDFPLAAGVRLRF